MVYIDLKTRKNGGKFSSSSSPRSFLRAVIRLREIDASKACYSSYQIQSSTLYFSVLWSCSSKQLLSHDIPCLSLSSCFILLAYSAENLLNFPLISKELKQKPSFLLLANLSFHCTRVSLELASPKTCWTNQVS